MRLLASPLSRWTALFLVLDLLFLLAGAFVLVVSFLWRILLAEKLPDTVAGGQGHLWMKLAVSPGILNAGIAFAGSAFLSVLVSLGTIFTRPSKDSARTKPVVAYIFLMFLIALGTVSMGTIIWFLTLRERSLFTPMWPSLPLPLLISIQNTLSCCGWTSASPQGLFDPSTMQTGFCQDPVAVAKTVDPAVGVGCIGPVVKKMDEVLNNIFTTIYGFIAIEICLLLSAATIAQLRQQERRLLQIDYKNGVGKRTFV